MDGNPLQLVSITGVGKQTIIDYGFYGVSHQKKHNDSSYAQHGVFGIAGSNHHIKMDHVVMIYEQINILKMKLYLILLDLKKGELQFQVSGDDYVGVVTEIRKDNKEGWVPHVGMYYRNGEVQGKKYSNMVWKEPKSCKILILKCNCCDETIGEPVEKDVLFLSNHEFNDTRYACVDSVIYNQKQ